MEKINRHSQRQLLDTLAHRYPEEADLSAEYEASESAVTVNTRYLEEHGLLKAQWSYDHDAARSYPVSAVITARGLDFLADDGGLGAILGVVSIKLHDETLKALLIQRIERAEGDESAKAQLVQRIKGLPAESVSEIAKRLVERGIDGLPGALNALVNLLPI